MQKSSSTPAVSLQRVSKSYDRPVIADLSLEVAQGEFLAIVGPSGSGKTTTMRLIGGFELPDAGRVLIAGEDVTALPPERRDVNTVFQSYALFPHLSVFDNITFGPRMHGVSRAEREARARELLELVHLGSAGKRLPSELSGGMQQRVALARALANRPAVLLLDEPLGALDRKLREELQRELRRVQSTLGATFIYVTHDQDEAFGMADRLAVMRDGRIEQIGDPASIYDRPANAWVALFIGGANSFAGTVGGPGSRSSVATPFGPVSTDHVAPDLKGGEPALVVVRPEATRIEPAAAPPASGRINRIPARLADLVAIGPSLRLRAATPQGLEFEALMRRAEHPAHDFHPGDEVFVAFDAASTRVYRPDAATRPPPAP
ncbi:MAG TPA: ABC transporter ATP-binding protein [Devosia sp.]|nr:ABC transporter ATP-binding protein [Devosia sp.]